MLVIWILAPAGIAQLVEHLIRNQGVSSSNLLTGSSIKQATADFSAVAFFYPVILSCCRIRRYTFSLTYSASASQTRVKPISFSLGKGS